MQTPRHIFLHFCRQLCITAVVVFMCTFLSANFSQAVPLPEIVRLTLPLSDNNDYQIEHIENRLIISFTRPIKVQNDLTASIPDILGNQNLSADGKTLSFETLIPLTISGRRAPNRLIIELVPQDDSKKHLNTTKVALDIFKQDNTYIFDFSFPHRILYTINAGPRKTTLYLLTPVEININGQDKYPEFNNIRQLSNAMGGINFEIPSRLLSTHEENGKLRLEVSTPDAQPAEFDEEETDSGYFFEDSVTPSEQTISLSFPWNVPTGAAVFERGGYLWIAFDHRKKLDLDSLTKQTSPLVSEILNIPHTRGTILRLTLKEPLNIGVRREGLLWIIDLYKGSTPEKIHDLAIFTQYNANKQPYFYIPSSASGNVLSVVDPEVGDNMNIAPLADIGSGINTPYDYPDMTFLHSYQGLALVPKTTDLRIERGNTGIVISADKRGLNLSSDLETLRRKQSLAQDTMPSVAFDFAVSPQLLEKPYNEALAQLKNDIATVPAEQQNAAKLNLAKYYISMAMGPEALSILKDLQNVAPYKDTEQMHTLLGIADFLTHRYASAIEHFSYGNLPQNDEAIFWRTVSSAALEHRAENNAILISFISLTKNYPQALKERIASIAAAAALTAGDDISAQNFIDILKSAPYKDLYHLAEIDYLVAMRRALQGYPRNAIKEFRELGRSEAIKYSALARFEGAKLSNRLGFLPVDKTIEIMERLRFAWRDEKFRLNLLQTLAELYIKNNDYYSALRKLNQSLPLETDEGRQQTMKRMVNTFEDIYINNRADNMPLLKSLALYHDFEWLAPQSPHYNEIVQKLADRLVAVDLLPRAQQLLSKQLKYSRLSPLERSKTGTRLALINLFEGNPSDALEILNLTETPDLPESLKTHRKIIRAKTLAELGHTQEAIALLDGDFSKNALLMKSEFYWNNQEWDKASDTIRYLVEKPRSGHPLSEKQMEYILDWATALNMAGKTTVLVRLRNKFMPFFKDTKYYSTFSILTSNLEDDKVDLTAVNQAINDISAFRNFTRIYNDSLRNGSLSETIN